MAVRKPRPEVSILRRAHPDSLYLLLVSLVTRTTSHLASRPPNARARRAGAHGRVPAALKRDERTKRRGDLPLAVVPLSSHSLRLRSIGERRTGQLGYGHARPSMACCMCARVCIHLTHLLYHARNKFSLLGPAPQTRVFREARATLFRREGVSKSSVRNWLSLKAGRAWRAVRLFFSHLSIPTYLYRHVGHGIGSCSWA
jgi:hypothetical protein